ncbi:MAG: heme-binding domain-containing protein [Edaphobacter sp.]
MLGSAALCATVMIGLGYVHPFGNPRNNTSTTAEDANNLLKDAHLPSEAKAVLVTKCADCHSEATKYPRYARIAPGSWLIERDVIEGRQHMNLSKWVELTPDERQVIESKIIQRARNDDMPPIQYRILHWDAKLAPGDLQALYLLNRDRAPIEAAKAGAGDPVHGKLTFDKRCTGCHTIETNREGPRLRGVFGRKAGAVSDFTYSMALKASGITWNEDMLDKWLSDTDAMIPGNNMGFRVMKSVERADLIAYLKQTK